MSGIKEQHQESETEVPKRRKQSAPKKLRVFKDLSGAPLFVGHKGKVSLKEYNVDKFDADVLVYWHGEHEVETQGKAKSSTCFLTEFDPDNAMGKRPLSPSVHSPVCAKCQLHHTGCRNPYLPYLTATEHCAGTWSWRQADCRAQHQGSWPVRPR